MLRVLSIEAKVILWLAICVVIAYVVAFAIGPENKRTWFRRRQKFSMFGKRGFLGDYIHFGYPCTLEGVVVAIVMLTAAFGVGYFILLYV